MAPSNPLPREARGDVNPPGPVTATGGRPVRTPAARAFTLAEVLVVVAITGILIALLVPMIARAQRSAQATRLAADLQTISVALTAYQTDFGDYPRFSSLPSARTASESGPILLAWALVGPYEKTATGSVPFDGADGPGFRIRATGRVYGPYLSTDRLRLSTVAGGYKLLTDNYDTPILYYPAKPGARPDIRNTATGDANWFSVASATNAPLFDASYSSAVPTAALLARVKEADFTGPYLLWSAGVDRTYSSGVGSASGKDDVTNIPPK